MFIFKKKLYFIEMAMTKTELNEIKARLFEGIIDFKKTADVSYSYFDIFRLKRILGKYYRAMAKLKDKNLFKEPVKKAVLQINSLNEKTDYEMIETDQREDICAFIIGTALFFNFISNPDDDITGEWREW